MDGALKARNLGSATARRTRMQERQIQQHLAHQERLDRKRHLMSEVHSFEGSEDDSDFSTSSNPELDHLAETPSEPMIQTPEDRSSSNAFIALSPTTYCPTSQTKQTRHEMKESEPVMSKPQSRPRMQATLTTIADWNYDRFSVILDPSEVEEAIAEAVEDDYSSSDSNEEQEEYSPIEIATSVLYTLPKARPSVVSITSFHHHIQPLRVNKATASQHPVRRHVSEQMALESSSPNGFRAGEAKLFQLSNSSRETIGSGNNSGQMSRSISLASHSESIVSSQTSQSDQSNKSPKRKSSLPLLFGSNKNGHSRMSSFKKLIRSSTIGPPSAANQSYASLQRQTSCATLETHFESRNSSMDVPRSPVVEFIQRPMLERTPSPLLSIPGNATALPPKYPHPNHGENEVRNSSNPSQEAPSKSISKFRARSGSIGLALKSINTSARRSDASAPPLPNGSIPLPTQPYDPQSLPSPPPLTPRNPRRTTANYSPFPNGGKRSSSAAVGLGLRY